MEKQNLWQTMGRLNQYVYIAEQLDTKLTANIAEIELSDPERAKQLNQDVLFYVRQKHQDLLTQLAVSIQSYLAIDIIIKEQHRAHQGRRPGGDDNRVGAPYGGHRRSGARQPAARAGPDHSAQHDDIEHDPEDVGDAEGELARIQSRPRPRRSASSS